MGVLGANGVSLIEALPLAGGTITGPLLLPDGSTAAPSLAFSNKTNTGFFLSSSSTMGVAIAGNIAQAIKASSLVFGSQYSINWTSAAFNPLGTVDLSLARDAADTFAQRRGTNAQTFNLYNTFTDASNYERLAINAASAADVQIVPEAAGTGTLRGLQLSSASGRLGFYGTTAIAKPAVTGSRAGNAALADLLTELANLGILTDSSSA